MKSGIRWAVRDRYGNQIYLTEERWEHITEAINHPEMLDYEHELQMTIRWAVRKQDSLNPQKYRYSMAFDELADDNRVQIRSSGSRNIRAIKMIAPKSTLMRIWRPN